MNDTKSEFVVGRSERATVHGASRANKRAERTSEPIVVEVAARPASDLTPEREESL